MFCYCRCEPCTREWNTKFITAETLYCEPCQLIVSTCCEALARHGEHMRQPNDPID